MAFGFDDFLGGASLVSGILGKKEQNDQIAENNQLQKDAFAFKKEMATAPIIDALGNRFDYEQGRGFKSTLAPNQQTLLKSQEAQDLATGPGGLNARLKFDTDAKRRGQDAGMLSQQLLQQAGRVPALTGTDVYNIDKADASTRVNSAFDQIARMVALSSARTGNQLPSDVEQRALALTEAMPSYTDSLMKATQLGQATDPYLLNLVAAAEGVAQGGYVPFQYTQPDISTMGQGQRYLSAAVAPPQQQAEQSPLTLLANAINAGREMFTTGPSGETRQLGNQVVGPANGPPRFVGNGTIGG